MSCLQHPHPVQVPSICRLVLHSTAACHCAPLGSRLWGQAGGGLTTLSVQRHQRGAEPLPENQLLRQQSCENEPLGAPLAWCCSSFSPAEERVESPPCLVKPISARAFGEVNAAASALDSCSKCTAMNPCAQSCYWGRLLSCHCSDGGLVYSDGALVCCAALASGL